MVAEGGLEPPRSDDQRILSPMCLPIPPLGHDSNIAWWLPIVKHKLVKKMLTRAAFPNKQKNGRDRQNIEQYKAFRIRIRLLRCHFEYQ